MNFGDIFATAVVFIILFVFTGGMYFLGMKMLKKNLSYKKVYAKCVEIAEKERGLENIRKMYCPIYEYEHEGRLMRASDHQFVSTCYEPVGSTRILYVHKNEPHNFLYEKPKSTIAYAFIFVGTVFLFVSILCIKTMFFEG